MKKKNQVLAIIFGTLAIASIILTIRAGGIDSGTPLILIFGIMTFIYTRRIIHEKKGIKKKELPAVQYLG